jgi:hypothetical protein
MTRQLANLRQAISAFVNVVIQADDVVDDCPHERQHGIRFGDCKVLSGRGSIHGLDLTFANRWHLISVADQFFPINVTCQCSEEAGS